MAQRCRIARGRGQGEADQIEARNWLDSMVYNIEKMLKESGDKVSGSEKSDVESALADAKKTLEGTPSASELNGGTGETDRRLAQAGRGHVQGHCECRSDRRRAGCCRNHGRSGHRRAQEGRGCHRRRVRGRRRQEVKGSDGSNASADDSNVVCRGTGKGRSQQL